MKEKMDLVVTTLKAMISGDPDELVLLEIKLSEEDEGNNTIDRFLVRRKSIKDIADKINEVYRNYYQYGDTDSDISSLYSSIDEAIVTLITCSDEFEIVTVQSESVIVG